MEPTHKPRRTNPARYGMVMPQEQQKECPWLTSAYSSSPETRPRTLREHLASSPLLERQHELHQPQPLRQAPLASTWQSQSAESSPKLQSNPSRESSLLWISVPKPMPQQCTSPELRAARPNLKISVGIQTERERQPTEDAATSTFDCTIMPEMHRPRSRIPEYVHRGQSPLYFERPISPLYEPPSLMVSMREARSPSPLSPAFSVKISREECREWSACSHIHSPNSMKADPTVFYRGGTICQYVRSEDEDWESAKMQNTKNLRRFGRSKLMYLVADALWTLAGTALFIFAMFTYTETYAEAAFIKMGASIYVHAMTSLSLCMVITGLMGFFGLLMHRKVWLATQLVSIVAVMVGLLVLGYITHRAYQQETKGVGNLWTQLSTSDQTLLQDTFGCCGGLSPFDAPQPSTPQCRMALSNETAPIISGCLMHFGSIIQPALQAFSTVSFALVPLAVLLLSVGILSAHHVDD